MNVLLLGYYGFHNIGDDLMLDGLIELLSRNPLIKKILIPVYELYYSPKPFTEYVSLPSSLIGWIKLVRHSHAIIWGGGTCLYANSGLLWLFLISFFSCLMRKKLSFVSVGVENTSGIASFLIRMILKMVHFISLREGESFRVTKDVYKMDERKIMKSYDLVYLSVDKLLSKKCKHKLFLNRVSFSGHYAFLSKSHIEYCSRILSDLLERHSNLTIHFLPAHEGNSTDNMQHSLIIAQIPTHYRRRLFTYEDVSLEQYVEQMATMDFHIGFRLHSVFIAEYLNIPYLALAYAPKVRIFASSHGRYSANLDERISSDIVEKIFYDFSPCEISEEQLKKQISNIKECVEKALH